MAQSNTSDSKGKGNSRKNRIKENNRKNALDNLRGGQQPIRGMTKHECQRMGKRREITRDRLLYEFTPTAS